MRSDEDAEGESERDGGVGGEGLRGEVYRVKELIMARGKVEASSGYFSIPFEAMSIALAMSFAAYALRILPAISSGDSAWPRTWPRRAAAQTHERRVIRIVRFTSRMLAKPMGQGKFA